VLHNYFLTKIAVIVFSTKKLLLIKYIYTFKLLTHFIVFHHISAVEKCLTLTCTYPTPILSVMIKGTPLWSSLVTQRRKALQHLH